MFGGVGIVAVVLGGGAQLSRFHHHDTPHLSNARLAGAPDVALPFQLIEASTRVGLTHHHEKSVPHRSLSNAAPFISGLMGASVAVVDYDHDGWPDIYFTSAGLGSRNGLYHNERNGTFTDRSDESGLGRVNGTSGSLRAVFFDYDNDGFDDLLLTTTWCPQLFHNRGDGTFEEVSASAGLSYCGPGWAANVIDYDGDGRLDIVTAGYFPPVDIFNPQTTAMLPVRQFYRADGGGALVVYHNDGGGHFSRVPDALGMKSKGWVHAIGVYDLHQSGRQDLYFANDWNYDSVYWNDGSGHFSDASDRATERWYVNSGMSAEIGDFNNDGLAAVFVTDIYEPGNAENLNHFWFASHANTMEDRATDLGVSRCGWAWGSKFVDLGNRGHLDLAISNGFISGNPHRTYWYEDDVLQATGEIARDARNWPPMGDASLAGFQSKCVFSWDGQRLVDVSASTEMGQDRSDGRGLAAIDFMNTGLPSLVEANVGQPARFFQNVAKHANHWIGFDLTGTRSNRDAFGAVVTVKLSSGLQQSRELEPANGFQSESDHRLLFGLGANPAIESVSIRWPRSGMQELSGLTIDRYHEVTEP